MRAAPAAEAVELTFLQALPGQREALRRYIERNRIEMDRVAETKGLMDRFFVLDSGSDDGDWNLLMVVRHHDARGYGGIAGAFENIRKAHTEVLVDGKRLRDLGRIVESRKTLEQPH